jgi:hypothetical protein
MTFKKYCINRNIEEAVQILEYLESQGVVEEGVLGDLAGKAAKGIVGAGVAVGKRALDAAVSGVGRGAIEGGKRALNVALGKGKDPAPMIGNAISNLTAAIKLSPDLSKTLSPVLKDLGNQQKQLATQKAAGLPAAKGSITKAPTTTSTAASSAPAAKPAVGA